MHTCEFTMENDSSADFRELARHTHKCVCVRNIHMCIYIYDKQAVRDICVLTFKNLQDIHTNVYACVIYIYIHDQAVRDMCVLTFQNLQDIHTNVCVCI